jgi:outer membrane lipoprotein-sorting protein
MIFSLLSSVTRRGLRPVWCALMLSVLAVPALANFDVAQLMAELAKTREARAKFVEKRYLAVLDKPVVSNGELAYSAPDKLEKRTISPKPEVLQLNGDTLTLERDKRKLSIQLSNQPEALAFVDSIRGTLSGNRTALEKHYAIRLNGTADKWTLTLLPSDQKIATLLRRITINGKKNLVYSIEYQQADGDRAVMTIEPLESH